MALRQTGTLRRIKRFAKAPSDGVPVRDNDHPGSAGTCSTGCDSAVVPIEKDTNCNLASTEHVASPWCFSVASLTLIIQPSVVRPVRSAHIRLLRRVGWFGWPARGLDRRWRIEYNRLRRVADHRGGFESLMNGLPVSLRHAPANKNREFAGATGPTTI